MANRLNMGANFIPWAAIVLESIIFFRGLQNRLIRDYFLFYSYIATVLLADIARLCCYHFAPNFYTAVYWSAELAVVVASYIVVIEIFKQVLKHNPGAARLTGDLLLIVFAFLVVYGSSDLVHGGFRSMSRVIAELARDLRYAEGALLLVMLSFFVRYRISASSNLLGLIFGYAYWVGINIMTLALWFLPGNGLSLRLRTLLPLSYNMALLIWCVTLWAVRPNPVQPPENDVERDYELLATKTRGIFARVSSGLVRTMRP